MTQIGIGIDAGGTYTDVVVYSFEKNEALATAKALTRKEDLSIGIDEVLDALPEELLQKASYAAISTTLATNACVEDKGCRGKLLFIGVDPKVVDWVGDGYGLPPLEEIRFINRVSDKSARSFANEDWALFYDTNQGWFQDADGVAVVDIYRVPPRKSSSEIRFRRAYRF